MTKTLSEYSPLESDNLLEYAAEKHEEIMRLLHAAKEQNKIDEFTYRRLSLDVYYGFEWDECFDHYQYLFGELSRTLIDKEIQTIQERLIKGAQMIEDEQDPIKRRQYLKVYDALLNELESLKERGKSA